LASVRRWYRDVSEVGGIEAGAKIFDRTKHGSIVPTNGGSLTLTISQAARAGTIIKSLPDAINRCSTGCASWHVVLANHKWARNLAIAEIVLRTIKKMDPRYPKLSFDPKTIKIS
jgi:hypothetical protein